VHDRSRRRSYPDACRRRTAQASDGAGAEPDRGIPCGGRIQYEPTIDVDSIDTSDAGKTILRALQIYGAYVGDYSGAISLYADNSPAAQAYYNSIGFDSYELLDVIQGSIEEMESPGVIVRGELSAGPFTTYTTQDEIHTDGCGSDGLWNCQAPRDA
jgi:hypothetical protein